MRNMKDTEMAMNTNRIAQYLGKPAQEFTKRDLMKFIEGNDIGALNLRFVGGDGRLKTLNFMITGKDELDPVLSGGERVDGSSLFPYIDAASSDLYIVPRYKTAYVNPFTSIPTVDILCSYYTEDGTRLPSSPENLLSRAHEVLKDRTGMNLEVAGELEYYVVSNRQSLYRTEADKGYQESSPFCKWEALRCEAMQAITQAGGRIKYGHSEIGYIPADDKDMEQNEIEFNPEPVEDAADHIVVAKWMLRMIGYKYGVQISFSPKIVVGHAGSGLHIHTRLTRNGKNAMVEGGGLTDTARKVIAGYLTLAPSLTAFGNTVPLSFLRLVPHQEAPTNICWGDRNRSVLVRIPLGWLNVGDMARDANPQETEESPEFGESQTVEFRASDGSANIYLLLAGLAVATRHGLEMPDALEVAERLYVDVNIFAPKNQKLQGKLPELPTSCWESAEYLLRDRHVYEKDTVFSPVVIEGLAKMLKSYNDRDLSEQYYGERDELKKLVDEYFNC